MSQINNDHDFLDRFIVSPDVQSDGFQETSARLVFRAPPLFSGSHYNTRYIMAATNAATYQETVSDIEETIGLLPGFMAAVPEDTLVHEWPVFKQYVLGESVIPPKYREMIELAVAASMKCPYCEAFHRGAAELHGATEDELAEVGVLASLTTRWSAMIHAQHYDYDTFIDEFHQIGEFLQEQQAAD